jgi:hypothetical protein
VDEVGTGFARLIVDQGPQDLSVMMPAHHKRRCCADLIDEHLALRVAREASIWP